MVIAAGTTAYNIVELLHVLTVLVALAPVFVHPLLRKQMQSAGGSAHQQLVVAMASNARRLYGPALIVAGLLGIALVEMSEDAISLTEGWVIAAIVIWVVMNGVLHGMIRPALKAQGIEGASPATDKRLEVGSALPVDRVHGPADPDDLAARLIKSGTLPEISGRFCGSTTQNKPEILLPEISGRFCGSTTQNKPEILIGPAAPGLMHAPARIWG